VVVELVVVDLQKVLPQLIWEAVVELVMDLAEV
jgi:hypothetical protein